MGAPVCWYDSHARHVVLCCALAASDSLPTLLVPHAASMGNKTERIPPTAIAMLASVVTIVLHVYFFDLQVYVYATHIAAHACSTCVADECCAWFVVPQYAGYGLIKS